MMDWRWGRSHLTIQQRLILNNVIASVLFLFTSGVAVWQIYCLAGAASVFQLASRRTILALRVQQSSTALMAVVDRSVPDQDGHVFETDVAQALEVLNACQADLKAFSLAAKGDAVADSAMSQVNEGIGRVIALVNAMMDQAKAGEWLSVREHLSILRRDYQQVALQMDDLIQLTSEMEKSAALQLDSAQRTVILYPLVGFVFTAVLMTWLSRRTRINVSRSIGQLIESAAHLTLGSMDQRMTIEGPQEMTQLADAFNQMANRLRASYADLEARVAARTAELQRHAIQLQTAAEVARDAAAVREVDILLNRAVDLIKERFGFYHAGIFLVDEAHVPRRAVLRAATGEAGRQMLAHGHSLEVGHVGLVGYVTGTAQPRIALDVGADAVHFKNPFLPETRSEMALPLKVGERVIGALDVQSRHAAAFDENDVTVLQTMADQLAMAIENAHLWQEMQKAVDDLAQERNTLNATLDTLPDLLFEVDRAGHIYDFRARHTDLLYLLPDNFLGKRVNEVLPAEAANVIMNALDLAVADGRHSGSLYSLEMPSGEEWFELSVAAKGDPQSPTARFIALVRDVTGRVRAEQALRQYTRELEARNQELDAFDHTVAHDLQNPLGIIIGFASALEEDCQQLPVREMQGYLHTMAQNGRKMSNIVDELLLLASVRKQEDVKMAVLDTAHLVAEALGRLTYLIEEHEAELVLPPAGTAAWPPALGYGAWVEEVWVNYLSNAIKYGGRPPRVELGADYPFLLSFPQEREINGEIVRFWVRDNGLGLSSEEQLRLFTPFTQLDRVRAKGHGLGLSIVRRIVEKLGGQVGVESQVGQGSLFWFTLPACQDLHAQVDVE